MRLPDSWSGFASAARTLQTPALTAYRRRGDSKARDALWSAACWEAAALDLQAQGSVNGAARCLERAREVEAEVVAGLSEVEFGAVLAELKRQPHLDRKIPMKALAGSWGRLK